MRKVIHFFDRLEDKIRGKLSHTPILYALLGGIGLVLFWRGVWHIADDIDISSVASIIIGSIILLVTGVFVSAFIGNRLIISGLSGDKKLEEKVEEEIETEEAQIKKMQSTLNKVEEEISKISDKIEKIK